jgi:hypothetical protein
MKESRFKTVAKWFLSIALGQLFKVIAYTSFATIGTYLSANVIVDKISVLKDYWGLVFVFIFALSCLGLSWLFSKSEKQASLPPIDPDLKIVERHISYKWISHSKLEYRKFFKFKALKNVVDRYSDRWNWTGSGDVKVTSLIHTQSIMNPESQGIWDIFDIKFNESLNKNDVIDSEILWCIENIGEKPNPFCSATIQEPTGLLKFKISFPEDFKIKEVLCEQMHSISSKEVISRIKKNIDRNNEVEWTIEKPELLHHYQVRWHWSN